MFHWLKLLVMKDPDPEDFMWMRRVEKLESDVKEIRESLKDFAEDVGKTVRELKSSVSELKEKDEWNPQFGDRVRFKHDFFGEMEGIFLEAIFPEKWSLMFRDPSNKGGLKHYTADAKDVEKGR